MSSYWQERARLDKLKVIRTSEKGIDNLKRLLKLNLDDVEKKINEFFKKYGEEAKYAESLSYSDFQKYKARLRAKAKKYPNDKTLQRIARQDIPKYRIDRLRALQTDLQIQLTEATKGQEEGIYKTLDDVAKVSQANAVSRYRGIGLEFNTIASRKMKQILSSDWSGASWSDRLWEDREIVGEKLTDILEKGIPQGTSLQKMSRELSQITGQSFNNAFRLVRTESAHVDNSVLLESFRQAKEEMGYTHYIYDAFMDSRTSQICKDLDGKRFAIDDAVIGENLPPMHPNCRSTAVLDISSKEDDEDMEEDLGKEELVDNPKINDKTVRGSYNKEEIKKLQGIADKYKELGFEPSGHAIQRTFERNIKPERAIDVVNNGKKYKDSKNAIGYYKNRVSVHISKETGQIKTIIYYDKNDTPPLKRNKNGKRKK